MTEAVEIIEQTVAPAPFELEPLCTREMLTRPPDWRYQQARQYLADMKQGQTPVIPSDHAVQYVIRALAANSRSPMHRRMLFNMWPVMEEVLYYGITARRSTLAAELDTCLIKGWDHDKAFSEGCPFRRETYDLYAAVFFDLSGVRAIHAWIHDYLFEPERYGHNQTLLRARLVAYYGQGSAGRATAIAGMLPKDESSIMKQLISNERQKQIFDYMLKHTKMDPDTYATLMEAAVKSLSEHEFQEHMRDREDAGSSSLEELAEGIEEGVRAYSQQELEQPSEDGLDFSNKYTQVIIDKE